VERHLSRIIKANYPRPGNTSLTSKTAAVHRAAADLLFELRFMFDYRDLLGRARG
jgi:hypothetical protein